MCEQLTCSRCGPKPQSSFWKDRTRKRGYHAWCKDCCRTNNYEYETGNPPKALVLSTRARAKKLSVPFDLVEKDIVIPSHCPILGIPLAHSRGNGTGPKDNSPSIDRIVPEKGYVRGNVVVVSFRANRIKSNATPDEILAVGNFYKELLNV